MRFLRVVLSCLVLAAVASSCARRGASWDPVAEMGVAPGNIAVTPEGRRIVSLHHFFAPDMRVGEVTPDGRLVPFPAHGLGAARADAYLGVAAGPGYAALLDNGLRGKVPPELVWVDTKTDTVERVHAFPPGVVLKGSFFNDLAVDVARRRVYIADPANGADAALVVLDLDTGRAWRVLQGHKSVVPEDIDLFVDGKPVEIVLADGKRIRPRIGVNPIAMDHRGDWVYYGPMHGTGLYRVRAEMLANENASPGAVANSAERYADKPICDGIAMDANDTIYISAIGQNAIGVIPASTRVYEIAATDRRLSWPDSFAVGPDGNVYGVANQLHLSPPLNGGGDGSKKPYLLFRLPVWKTD